MLAPYLKELLYRYERVIIPGFGGIVTEHTPARLDEEKQVFLPPLNKLQFDPNLIENDDLLVNFIASKDEMTHDSAMNFVKFQVDDWKEKLETESLVLDDLGVFSKDEEGTVQFSPDETSHILTESFGLSETTTITALEDSEDREITPIKPIRKRKKKRKKSGWGSFLSYAATFALLFTIGWFLYQQILKNNADMREITQIKEEQDKEINAQIRNAIFEIKEPLPNLVLKINHNQQAEIQDSVIPQEDISDFPDIQNTITPSTDTIVKQNTTLQEPVKETTKLFDQETTTESSQTSPVSKRYYIIAGAFSTTENANKKVAQLKNNGFDKAQIIDNPKSRLTQVAFASYSEKNKAELALENIKLSVPDAWLLEK
jgi:cell division septation protein DedD